MRNNFSRIEKGLRINYASERICDYINIWTRNERGYQIRHQFQFPITPQEMNWLAEEISIWFNSPLLEQDIDGYNMKQEKSYIQKAYDYLDLNDFTKALEMHDIAVQYNPQSDRAYLSRGMLKRYMNNYQGTVEDCSIALEINPNLAIAYFYRGEAFYNLEKYQLAIKNSNYAIRLNPNYQDAYHNRAAAYLKLGIYEQVVQNCNQLFELNPEYVAAYQIRACAYLELNDFQKSLHDCNSGLEINPNLSEIYNTRGFVYFYLGNLEKSLADLSKQLELKETAIAYYNFGLVLLYSNELKALESFSKCIELDSKYKFAYYALSNIYYAQNNRDAALQDYQTATELENTVSDTNYRRDEHAYYARGLARYQIGKDIDGAIKDIEKAKEIATQHQYTEFVEKAIALLEEINQC